MCFAHSHVFKSVPTKKNMNLKKNHLKENMKDKHSECPSWAANGYCRGPLSWWWGIPEACPLSCSFKPVIEKNCYWNNQEEKSYDMSYLSREAFETKCKQRCLNSKDCGVAVLNHTNKHCYIKNRDEGGPICTTKLDEDSFLVKHQKHY